MSAAKFSTFVLEFSNTPGTGPFALNGAPSGRRTWAQGFTSGDVVYYFADDGTQAEWGTGTYTQGSPSTITRDTVLGNTAGSTAHLNFTGQTNVYSNIPAERLSSMAQGSVTLPQTSFTNAVGSIVGSASIAAIGSTLRVDMCGKVANTDKDRPGNGYQMVSCTLSLYATDSSGAKSGSAIGSVTTGTLLYNTQPGYFSAPLLCSVTAGQTYLAQLLMVESGSSNGVVYEMTLQSGGLVWLAS